MVLRFSPKSAGHLVEAMESGYTHAHMGTLLLKAGVSPWAPESYSNKADRAQKLLRVLQEDSSPSSSEASLELARLVLVHGKSSGHREASPWWPPLRASLVADGLDFDEDTDDFLPVVPGADIPAEFGWIRAELLRRGWVTAAGHYEQAVESFSDGRWAAANGQIRSFYESLIRTAGGTQSANGPGQVQAAIDALDRAGHLIADEADFAKKLWKMLHPSGSHPGLSDEDESRFRLLSLTGYARFLLARIP